MLLVLNFIKEIVDFMSNLPGAAEVIKWIKKHVGLWGVGILISLILIFIYSGVSKVIPYPYPDGKYNLRLITKANMESVCGDRRFYRIEIAKQEGDDFQKIYSVKFLGLKNMEDMERYKGKVNHILPAYRLRCLYELERNVEDDLNPQPGGAIQPNSKRVDTGLDLEKYYCRMDKRESEKHKYRFVFINYKDPYSSFCIKDIDIQ